MSMDSIANFYIALVAILQPIFIVFVVTYLLRLASRVVGTVEKMAVSRGSGRE